MRTLTSALAGLALATSALHAQTNGMAEYQRSKYGFFVHFVWGGGPGTQFTKDREGKQPASFDEFAATFDATGFANDLDRWGVEYVILTAWHYNINPLFPSETMKKWGMAKHACKRDLLGDVITACKAKGIKVMFYTHPRDRRLDRIPAYPKSSGQRREISQLAAPGRRQALRQGGLVSRQEGRHHPTG